jgi:tellurite resistance protein TerC
MFAVDSIPASFSISRDPSIILTANLLAVAGLRSLYHAVSQGIAMVSGLEKYIGFVLILLGGFVFADHFITTVPSWFTMAAVFVTLFIGVLQCVSKSRLEQTANSGHN